MEAIAFLTPEEKYKKKAHSGKETWIFQIWQMAFISYNSSQSINSQFTKLSSTENHKTMTFINQQLALLIAFLLLATYSPIIAQATPPNIIVIITDDAGYEDWGFQGSSLMETPNIDQLVSQGTKFSQGYVTNSVCSPSRAGLITGRYQNRFGYEHNLVEYYDPPGAPNDQDGLDVNELTIANHLKSLGYATAAIGKWHLGQKDHFHPLNRGFDYFYGLLKGARPYFHTNDLEEGKKLMRNWQIDDLTSGYVTNVLTEDAINWMQDQVDSDQPFFTYLSYTAVHSPYQAARPEDLDRFSDCNCSEQRKTVAAMTYNLDANIGLILDFLEAEDEFDNTLIFFVNDNGGANSNDRHLNTPFRGHKSTFYEGGLRVPMALSWPDGGVPANNTYNKQVITLDFLPTIVAAAGGQIPGNLEIDGVNLIPYLSNPGATPHEYLFWRKLWDYSVVKKGDQKLVIRYNQLGEFDNDTLFYDLSTDIRENNNIIANHQATKQEFLNAYADWEEEMISPYFIGNKYFFRLCGGIGATAATDCPFFLAAYGFAATFEAEHAQLSGTAEISSCAQMSNGQFVKNLNGTSGANAASFELYVPYTGNYGFTITYLSIDELTMALEVNGVQELLNVPATTGQWCYQGGNPGDYPTTISLKKGYNTIKISNALLDKIEVSPIEQHQLLFTYEAEEALLSGNAVIENCAASSNGQTVKKLSGSSNNAVTFDANVPFAGEYQLTVSYISSTTRTMHVEINGTEQIIDIPATGLWCHEGGSPGDFTITANLNEGGNSIKFYKSPILDKIALTTSMSNLVADFSVTENAFITAKEKASQLSLQDVNDRITAVNIGPNILRIGQDINLEIQRNTPTSGDNSEYFTACIFDIYGRPVEAPIKLTANRFSLKTHQIKEAGLYFVKIASGNQMIIKELIIVK